MEEKINKKKESAINTKKKIFESAKWLFTKYGFDHVSVDSIVERAGVAKGSFYVHYKSKNSLIIYFLQDYVLSLDADYRTYYESFPANRKASEDLLALVGRIIDIIVDQIGYDSIRLIYDIHISKTVDTSVLLDYNRELYTIFGLITKKGIEQNEFKPMLPTDRLVKHFVLILRGYCYEWCIRYPDFDIKVAVMEHFQILLEGIKY